MPNTADVVIIGGGVMGVSTAYHLASRGCRGVVLVEREPFLGSQATGKCAGGIRHQFSTEINVRLSQLSPSMLARFEKELGQDIDLRWSGYLFLLDNEADVGAFRRNVAMQNRLGVPSRMLSRPEVAGMAPLLMAELILDGRTHSLDIGQLRLGRFAEGDLVREHNVV